MKKLVFFLLFAFFCIILIKAQDNNVSKPSIKIIGGALFASAGTTSFSSWKTPFTLGYNLYPNICIITNRTYHNFLYGLGNNTVKNVDGYFLSSKKNSEIYLALSKSLNSGVGTVAIGIEKMIEAGEVKFFLFSEAQTNINHDSKTKDLQLNIGLHVNIQVPLYTKKK
jgi:hypothetical protein